MCFARAKSRPAAYISFAFRVTVNTWDNDFFRFPGAHEDVVWRVNASVAVRPRAPLAPRARRVEVQLDYGATARAETAAVTAQIIDAYGRRGRKIAGRVVSRGPARTESVVFDLAAEASRVAAEGIAPAKVRVETRATTGRWITGDVALP